MWHPQIIWVKTWMESRSVWHFLSLKLSFALSGLSSHGPTATLHSLSKMSSSWPTTWNSSTTISGNRRYLATWTLLKEVLMPYYRLQCAGLVGIQTQSQCYNKLVARRLYLRSKNVSHTSLRRQMINPLILCQRFSYYSRTVCYYLLILKLINKKILWGAQNRGKRKVIFTLTTTNSCFLFF